MTIIANNGLSAPHRTVIMRAAVAFVALLLVCSFATTAAAQEQPQGKRDDLDVTMQIIVDPDAKLPDEVIRRIPLPTRKSAESPPAGTTGSESGKPEAAGDGKDKDRGNEAREHGRESSEAAKERAREAADQREAARRAEAEERRRERGPPDDRPNPPNRPPRN
jgi:hypothetical protein